MGNNTHPKIYIYVDRSHTNVRMQTHEDRNIFIYIYRSNNKTIRKTFTKSNNSLYKQ